MKTIIAFISVLCFVVIGATNIIAQPVVGDYRSIGSGPWNIASVWEYYNGSTWVTASSAPSSSSENITIRSGHVVTLSENDYIYVDQLVVESSAELQIPDVSWITVNDGTAENDVVVNGTLTLGGSVRGSGKVVINGICNWYYSVFNNWSSYSGISNTNFNISSSGNMNLNNSGIKWLYKGIIYNSGTITIPNGAGDFHGIEGAVLHNQSGGVVDVKSDSKIYSSSNSSVWSAGFTINNAGTIKKSAGSGTTTFERVTLTNTGTLQVQAGTVSIYYYATLNNTGTLQIANGASCSITGTSTGLSNFSSNTLSSGIYNIGGTFKFNSASITTNNATIILDGASAQIVNESDVNALANFATNGAAGSFTLENGRDFSTGAATFTNNGTLDCGSNTFSGSGNFTNASGSTLIIGSPDGITSSGASGNIQSSGTRTFHTGANYTYNGIAAQVTGDGLPAQVNNFTINNSTGATLTNDVTVNGELSLTNGDLSLNGKIITLGASANLSETSGNTVKGVTGKITTTRTFTSGDLSVGINIAGMGAKITTSSALGSTVIERTHNQPAGNSNTGISRIFNIAPTTNTGLDATLEFFYDESEIGAIAESNLRLFKSLDGTDNSWALIGGTVDVDNNKVTLSGLDGFSYWSLGDANSPLPVELTSFTAASTSSAAGEPIVVLNWQTATEVDNYGFEVERSLVSSQQSLVSWEKIGFVPGSGNSNSPKSYNFIDNDFDQDQNKDYILKYRLKQIDTDGSYEYYSSIAEVHLNITDLEEERLPKEFVLHQNYPNPFNPSTIIGYVIPTQSLRERNLKDFSSASLSLYNNILVTLKVYDILGREIAILVNEVKSPGYYEVEWNASSFSSGVYFYSLQAAEFKSVKKFVLNK